MCLNVHEYFSNVQFTCFIYLFSISISIVIIISFILFHFLIGPVRQFD